MAAAKKKKPSRKGKAKKPRVMSRELREIAASAKEGQQTKMGRPTDYRPEFVDQAREMCENGATDYDLAQRFGVTTQTIWAWQATHKDFSYALRVGKGAYDDRVERSLAQRAVGYTYHSEKIIAPKQGSTPIRVPVVEHVPPDVGAAKLWLASRRKESWSMTENSTQVTVNNNSVNLSDPRALLDLARWMAFTMTAAVATLPDQTEDPDEQQ